MTKSEALDVLNCSIIDTVDDAYENLIFEFKGKLLQITPPIKVLESIIKKICRINEAYLTFSTEFSVYKKTQINIKKLDENLDLADFLSQFQLNMTVIKLSISNSYDGESLVKSIKLLIKLQEELYLKLAFYLESKKVDLKKYDIKLSEQIEVFTIQQELKELQLDEPRISEYIRKQIEELGIEKMSYTSKSILNSAKQIVFNGIRREI